MREVSREEHKVQEGRSSGLYFCAISQIILLDPEKNNPSLGFSFPMSQMEMTVPISRYTFLLIKRKVLSGLMR